MTEVRLRPLAEIDLVDRAQRHRAEGGDELGTRFFDAAVVTLGAIGRMPGAGSLHLAESCGVPGLRIRRVPGFRCGWLYLVRADHVDIVRLLADAQDIPSLIPDHDPA